MKTLKIKQTFPSSAANLFHINERFTDFFPHRMIWQALVETVHTNTWARLPVSPGAGSTPVAVWMLISIQLVTKRVTSQGSSAARLKVRGQKSWQDQERKYMWGRARCFC